MTCVHFRHISERMVGAHVSFMYLKQSNLRILGTCQDAKGKGLTYIESRCKLIRCITAREPNSVIYLDFFMPYKTTISVTRYTSVTVCLANENFD